MFDKEPKTMIILNNTSINLTKTLDYGTYGNRNIFKNSILKQVFPTEKARNFTIYFGEDHEEIKNGRFRFINTLKS